MITRVTGKNQVTIPAKVAAQAGIKPGAMLDWTVSEKNHVLEVHVYPDPASLSKELRGRGCKTSKQKSGAAERLVEERVREEE
jgi:AbrB family looped-hinge helix DNA binding protein